jgi:hypothetical protein
MIKITVRDRHRRNAIKDFRLFSIFVYYGDLKSTILV